MARIDRIELAMVDLASKVHRIGAIQSFVAQLHDITVSGLTVRHAVAPERLGIEIDWDEDASRRRVISEFTTDITRGI